MGGSSKIGQSRTWGVGRLSKIGCPIILQFVPFFLLKVSYFKTSFYCPYLDQIPTKFLASKKRSNKKVPNQINIVDDNCIKKLATPFMIVTCEFGDEQKIRANI